MKAEEWQKDSITIRGREIPVKIGWMNQSELKFYPENPRVYTLISQLENPTQELIYELLLEREHVKQLIKSIRANGGLTDPIFVTEENLTVVEGNSRLAAYRYLVTMDPVKWSKIKCKLLPKDISEDQIFTLLGEYHIIGKQDWIPYEQAAYLFRRCIDNKNFPKDVAADLGFTTATVNLLIGVYVFMIKHNDNNPDRWSYYYEYLKSNKIKKVRKQFLEMDNLIVKKIKAQEISHARDVRDDLPIIIKAGKRVLSQLLSETWDFNECVERARSGGADNQCYMKLQKFRHWLVNPKTHDEICKPTKRVEGGIKFELKKIRSAIDHIEKHLDKVSN